MTMRSARRPSRKQLGESTHPIFLDLEVKAVSAETHTFEGLAATWDLDLGDDVIHPGAFKATLKEWRSSERVIPLLDQHQQFQSVRAAVGKLVDAKETREGLWTKWEVVQSQDGDEIMARLRDGVVKTLSIGYRPLKFDFEESDDARFGLIRHLHEVELNEVSLVLFPMQPGAQIDTDSVKAFAEKLTNNQRAMFKKALDELPENETEPTPDDEPGDEDSNTLPSGDDGDDDGAPDESALTALKLRRLTLNRG